MEKDPVVAKKIMEHPKEKIEREEIETHQGRPSGLSKDGKKKKIEQQGCQQKDAQEGQAIGKRNKSRVFDEAMEDEKNGQQHDEQRDILPGFFHAVSVVRLSK